MTHIVSSAVMFAIGFLVLAAVLPGMRVRGLAGTIKAGLVCGVLSAVFGKVLLALLKLVFFLPIALTGWFGLLAVQTLVNAALLFATARLAGGIEFDRNRTIAWAAFALTLFQAVAHGLE